MGQRTSCMRTCPNAHLTGVMEPCQLDLCSSFPAANPGNTDGQELTWAVSCIYSIYCDLQMTFAYANRWCQVWKIRRGIIFNFCSIPTPKFCMKTRATQYDQWRCLSCWCPPSPYKLHAHVCFTYLFHNGSPSVSTTWPEVSSLLTQALCFSTFPCWSLWPQFIFWVEKKY